MIAALALMVTTVALSGFLVFLIALRMETTPTRKTGNFFGPTRSCRICGCDDFHACVSDNNQACYWVEYDLCSACDSNRSDSQ